MKYLIPEWLRLHGFQSSNMFDGGFTPGKVAGVYVFCSLTQVLYIGSSRCLKSRLAGHEFHRNTGPFSVWWKSERDYISCELQLIKELRPLKNIAHNKGGNNHGSR